MKSIIIDDEKHVRDGLKLLADWSKFGIETIYEASNGEEAMKIISEKQPEIIFTDMRMPKCDGISLLQWIHNSELSSKTIVVSGYDDFEYMRNAIFYKSFDYLLKPIDPEILNETLEKAVNEWKEQALHRKVMLNNHKVINEVKPLYLDHLLSGLLTTSEVSNSAKVKMKEEFSIDITSKKVTIAIITIKPYVTRSFQGDEKLTFFTLINICNEILRGKNNGVSFRNENKDDELVLLFWNDKNVYKIIKQVVAIIYEFTKVQCCIAIGQESYNIVDAYQSAKHVLLKHNLLDKRKFNHILSIEDIHDHPSIHLLDYAEEMKWAIKSGSIEKVDTILERIFRIFQDEHSLSIKQIELWQNEFDILRKHWLEEYGIQDQHVSLKGNDFWNEDGSFSFDKFKAEKRKDFHNLIANLIDIKYQKVKNSMHLIEEYLRHNYQKEINLQEIADRFFLSREYISRKFKQEFNATITDYLMKIRMEKAKELLENPHLKIYEIANHVGYQNEKYFSKLFKKFIGESPNEYRNKARLKS